MVAPLYTRTHATAIRLITKYGKPASIVREVKSGPPHAPTVTTTTYACKVADMGYSLTNRNTTLILTGDKVGMIAPDAETDPLLHDRIRIDGVDYRIVDLQPWNPGGLKVLFQYVARI